MLERNKNTGLPIIPSSCLNQDKKKTEKLEIYSGPPVDYVWTKEAEQRLDNFLAEVFNWNKK